LGFGLPSANPSGPVIVQNAFPQAILSLLLAAAVAASLVAAPNPDGLAGALLGALMLSIAEIGRASCRERV